MRKTTNNSNRAAAIRLLFVFVVLILIAKAVQLQITDQALGARAERVGRSVETQYPSRGLIYDRNGQLLTINKPAYQIDLTYNQLAEATSFDTLEFCRLLSISRAYFEESSQKDWSNYRYSRIKPFLFLNDVPQERFAALQERLHEFPGFTANLRNHRAYPLSAGAHLIGFMGEANQAQIDNEVLNYRAGDYLGVSGLEYEYESVLRGKKGEKHYLVDNRGRTVADLETGEDEEVLGLPQVGANLQTTIDLDLQAYGERLMKNKVGSIVAIEPKTGDILAMVSAPSYDPNTLAIGQQRAQAYNALAQDSLQPLLNRAINGKYPPGSPFKTLVALIALQEQTLHPQRGMSCAGGFYSDGVRLTGCHAHPYCSSVEDAIAQSCNNYFVTAFLEHMNRYGSISPNRALGEFNEYLQQFGLAQRTGIDLPSEQHGFIPDSSFYQRSFAEDEFWRAIWVRSLAIGQGEYELTTLQMANLAATIANRGYWMRPHLVNAVSFGSDSTLYYDTEANRHDVDIEARHFETVIGGMRDVLLRGTATSAEVPGLNICGKTGTAENGTAVDHSIFFAFAPKDDPQIAIAVYVEYGGFGTTYAAPISSLMIEQYLRREISARSQWREDRLLNTNLLLLRP
ncbi:MAG: penicillin-binding protein 2 [Bacteroidota bacterium]